MQRVNIKINHERSLLDPSCETLIMSSAEMIDSLIKDSTLEVYDGDHYFFMKNAEDISKKIETTFLKTLEH